MSFADHSTSAANYVCRVEVIIIETSTMDGRAAAIGSGRSYGCISESILYHGQAKVLWSTQKVNSIYPRSDTNLSDPPSHTSGVQKMQDPGRMMMSVQRFSPDEHHVKIHACRES